MLLARFSLSQRIFSNTAQLQAKEQKNRKKERYNSVQFNLLYFIMINVLAQYPPPKKGSREYQENVRNN